MDPLTDSEKLDAILAILTGMQGRLDEFEDLLLAEIEADALVDFEPEGAAN